jgi:hypothetical protein
VQRSEIFVVTFIGKHFVRRCLEEGRFVRTIEPSTKSAMPPTAPSCRNSSGFRTSASKADITTLDCSPQCDSIFNFAAESHVDAPITNAKSFCITISSVCKICSNWVAPFFRRSGRKTKSPEPEAGSVHPKLFFPLTVLHHQSPHFYQFRYIGQAVLAKQGLQGSVFRIVCLRHAGGGTGSRHFAFKISNDL